MEIKTSIKDEHGHNQGFKDSPAMRVRTERRCDAIASEFDTKDNISILEIGCGTGEIANLLAKKVSLSRITAIDISKSFIESAKIKFSNPMISYETKDFSLKEDLGWIKDRGPFNYIVGNGILHHLYYRLDETLNNIRGLLKPSGKMVFWEPNILNPYCFLIFKTPLFRKMANLEPDEMAFSKKLIEKRLIDAGFINPKIEYKDFLLPNVPKSLIRPSIMAGKLMESAPLLKMMSQSIFISTENKP